MNNKTTKICCTLALLASVAATPAFSQANSFVGPSISLGVSAVGSNTDLTITNSPDVSTINFGKNVSSVPFLDVSYVFPSNSNFMFGIGARYDFAKNKSGGINDTASYDNIETGDVSSADSTPVYDDITVRTNAKISYKDHRSIYLMPMYLVNNSSAIFAKFGYHETKGNLTGTINISGVTSDGSIIENGTTNISGSKKFNGYGVGLGFRTILTNNLYMQIEAEMIDYDKESVIDGTTRIVLKQNLLAQA